MVAVKDGVILHAPRMTYKETIVPVDYELARSAGRRTKSSRTSRLHFVLVSGHRKAYRCWKNHNIMALGGLSKNSSRLLKDCKVSMNPLLVDFSPIPGKQSTSLYAASHERAPCSRGQRTGKETMSESAMMAVVCGAFPRCESAYQVSAGWSEWLCLFAICF